MARVYPDAEIVEVLVTAEVRNPEGTGTVIRTPIYCTSDSRVYQSGLIEWASDTVDNGEEADEPD